MNATSFITIRRTLSCVENKVEAITKGGRTRRLGLNESCKASLMVLKLKSRSSFVFSNSEGKHFRYEYLRDRFQRDQKIANVPRIRIHDIRHTFASHFVMNGGSIYDLKELLGHADVKTTFRYAHLAP